VMRRQAAGGRRQSITICLCRANCQPECMRNRLGNKGAYDGRHPL
jgi:hypothetical protein